MWPATPSPMGGLRSKRESNGFEEDVRRVAPTIHLNLETLTEHRVTQRCRSRPKERLVWYVWGQMKRDAQGDALGEGEKGVVEAANRKERRSRPLKHDGICWLNKNTVRSSKRSYAPKPVSCSRSHTVLTLDGPCSESLPGYRPQSYGRLRYAHTVHRRSLSCFAPVMTLQQAEANLLEVEDFVF